MRATAETRENSRAVSDTTVVIVGMSMLNLFSDRVAHCCELLLPEKNGSYLENVAGLPRAWKNGASLKEIGSLCETVRETVGVVVV